MLKLMRVKAFKSQIVEHPQSDFFSGCSTIKIWLSTPIPLSDGTVNLTFCPPIPHPSSGGHDETVRLWSNDAVSRSDPAAPSSVQGSIPGAGSAAAAAAGANLTAAGTIALSHPTGALGAATYTFLNSYRTKSTPVMSVQFTARNLLLAAGAFHLRSALQAKPDAKKLT
jgi:hypothetical protein